MLCIVQQIDVIQFRLIHRTGIAAALGDPAVLPCGKLLHCIIGELAQCRQQLLCHLLQIKHAQRGIHTGRIPAAFCDIVVNDLPPVTFRRNPTVFRKLSDPVGIVPAAPRLRLFGGNQIIGIRCRHQAGFKVRHQAGIKPQHIQMHTGIAQSTGHFRQAHAVAAEIFVIAIAANHTTAVVPQHQPVVIGSVIAAAILDKVGQCSTVCHVLHAQTVVH